MSETVTVHFLRKDGSESSAVIDPDAPWAVPADFDGITGFTLPSGVRTGVHGGGGGTGTTGTSTVVRHAHGLDDPCPPSCPGYRPAG